MRRLPAGVPAVIALWTCSSSAEMVTIGFTGTTASRDSTITAWFQFDNSAMSDRGVRFSEILHHGFLVTGSIAGVNGCYDTLVGGGMGFARTTPDPANLPVIQSLVMYNSAEQVMIMSNNDGDPRVFVGGTAGIGPPVYFGDWSYLPVPEPGTVSLLGLAACAGWCARRRRRPG